MNLRPIILCGGSGTRLWPKSKHYLKNQLKSSLIIIETRLGSYFGEDDIVRLDDPYDR